MSKWDLIFNKTMSNTGAEVSFFSDISFSPIFKVINVVGTNGKGSVSNYINQYLMNEEYNVGLFTSPHLITPTERIKVNGSPIHEYEFWKIYKQYEEKINFFELGFFQIMYVVSCLYFNGTNCKYVIMEAGIGGKHDSTNSLEGVVGVVTSISIDHTDLLSHDIENIAKEKAGIINSNMEFFLPDCLGNKIERIFIEECDNKNAKYNIVETDGDYQERNKSMAKSVGKFLTSKDFDNFTTPIGRSQLVNWKDKLITIDVAHNIDGILNSWEIIMDDYDLIVFYSKRTGSQKREMINFLEEKGKLIIMNDEEEFDNLFKEMNKYSRILLIGSFRLIGYFLKGGRNENKIIQKIEY